MSGLADRIRNLNWRHIAIGFGVWTLIGLSFSVRTYLYYLRQGSDIGFLRVTASYLIDAYLWGLASPIVFYLSRRYLIERKRFINRFFIHLGAAFLLNTLIHAISAPTFWYLGFADYEKNPYFGDFYVKTLSSPLLMHESLLIYWLIAIAAHAFEYYRQVRDRETEAIQFAAQTARLSEQLMQAQLSALKMQLHPHFLFNTLNSIAALLHRDVETADRMIARLSDFLRMTLKSSETHSVSLEKELEFLNTYLAIEKIRFQERLIVKTEIDQDARETQVPNLILQPLVENAVRHGLARVTANGVLKISAARQNGRVKIRIEDNGPGLSARAKRNGSGTIGVGIANTRARLDQFYAGDYQFEIIENPDAPGTVVILDVPYKGEEKDENFDS